MKRRLHPVRALVCAAALSFLGLAAAGGYALRTVIPGDSLSSLAARYRISVESLMAANGLTTHLIHPGDVLRVPYGDAVGGVAEVAPKPPPGFFTHTLTAGETLSDVAGRYGLALEALVGANPDLSSLDQLPAGVELLIPPEPGLVVTLTPDLPLTDLIRAYGLDPLRVVRANGLASPRDLQPGSLIFLPGVAPTEAMQRLSRVRAEENRYVWPLHGHITSYFGRRNLGLGTASFHRAIDIAAPAGTPVRAARAGTVIYAGWSSQGYGNLVKIRHHGGAETWYAHHSEVRVSVGQVVNHGDVIALVGSTGISTGPHLHFELHENGQPVDPLGYLP
jgi:murein DD-endopeptidase MepM/ murein hydrolase activator NlpD